MNTGKYGISLCDTQNKKRTNKTHFMIHIHYDIVI